MAVYTVTSNGDPESEGLTFEAAVVAANANAGADTIRFADGLQVVQLSDVSVISGELTIEGDRNNDGVSDVLLLADHRDFKRHLTILEGADVTITNVDFVSGYDRQRSWDGNGVRPRADHGASGADGTVRPGVGMDGGHGNDDAGNGEAGSDGVDGLDAAGSILNLGTLLLERVGFGRNQAFGEVGESGGSGGPGGSSRADRGKTDEEVQYWTSPEWNPDFYHGLVAGGNGGNGGDAGHGANGGDGGDGGSAAGAIRNEGHLTLVDTVFAGRLTSGTLVNGNEATGGRAGEGGSGGYGGRSEGGVGGNSGKHYDPTTGIDSEIWYIPRSYWDEPWASGGNVNSSGSGDEEQRWFGISLYIGQTNEAGYGGDGGNGGDGGSGGSGGNGGGAATIVNVGQLTGTAAHLPGGAEDNFVNEATSQAGGDGGNGGLGGYSLGGNGGAILEPVQTMQWGPHLHGWATGRPPVDIPIPGFIQDILDEVRGRDMPAPGSAGAFRTTGQAASGGEGRTGSDGSDGSAGASGHAVDGVLTDGAGTTAFTAANTLVYLHDMGQDPETGRLAFNIIRLGDVLTSFEIGWTVTGDGANPVSAADFAPGTALSGIAAFGVAELNRQNADGTYAERFQHVTDAPNNIRRVELEIAGDWLDEFPEGYRITLTGSAGGVVLGTDNAAGTVIDTMLDPALGPITGTPGPETLEGTADADEIDALAGDDVLRGYEGDDMLNGGDGADTINGGDGDDTIIGGESEADLRDVVFAGDGNDLVDGGYGNDDLNGMGGNDTIEGGFGVDRVVGGAGDDVLTGSAFSDQIFGNDGFDFINGGFGSDRLNGGADADRFFHIGTLGHGSDWIQDYSAAEGDLLVYGGAAGPANFQVNITNTAGAGDAGVDEAFVIWKPTGQILWALVDGGGQDEINLRIGGVDYDLLA